MLNEEIALPPQHKEYERALLSVLVTDGKVKVDLEKDDWYFPQNGQLFEIIEGIRKAGQPVDLAAIIEKAPEDWKGLIMQLYDEYPTSANAQFHAQHIKEASLLRSYIKGCREGIKAAMEGGTLEDVLSMHKSLTSALVTNYGSDIVEAKDLVKETFAKIEDNFEHRFDDVVNGIAIGFSDADNLLKGLQPGDVVVVAGRPGKGKSVIAAQIARHIARTLHVGTINLEMSKLADGMRHLSAISGVHKAKLRSGRLTNEDWPKLARAAAEMAELKLHSDYTSMKMASVERTIVELVQRHDVKVIMIDYLQLVKSCSKGRNRQEEVAEISRELKLIAKANGIVIIALSQLNREVESQHEQKPKISQLRESGAIEQDADVILFIWGDHDKQGKGPATLTIAKDRESKTGDVKLYFDGDTSQFFPADYNHGEEAAA